MTSKFLPHVQIICLRVRVIYPVPPLVLTSNTFKKGQIASRRDTWWCQWQGTKLDRRNHNKSCYWASPTVALTNSWKMNVLPAPEARPKRATAMMGMAVMNINILSSSTEKLLTDLTPSPPSLSQWWCYHRKKNVGKTVRLKQCIMIDNENSCSNGRWVRSKSLRQL